MASARRMSATHPESPRGAPLPDRLLDVHEAAALLGLAPATLYGWVYRRRLPVVKLSGPRGPVRFRASDIARLIERHTRPALRA